MITGICSRLGLKSTGRRSIGSSVQEVTDVFSCIARSLEKTIASELQDPLESTLPTLMLPVPGQISSFAQPELRRPSRRTTALSVPGLLLITIWSVAPVGFVQVLNR